MACEQWRGKLDLYVDGELEAAEANALSTHLRSCSACASAALERVQLKRSIQTAGKRYEPRAELRKKIAGSAAAIPVARFGWWRWAAVAALALIVAGGWLYTSLGIEKAQRQRVYSELADLHVSTLASATPVDVLSSDRHTVKPWFQGKIPFAFNLPELQNSDFSLVGGRMVYLEQAPGAHLIYDVRKHHISVLVFQERSLPASLDRSPKKLPFNMETWSQSGLRYFVISDASAADIDRLAKLFKAAS